MTPAGWFGAGTAYSSVYSIFIPPDLSPLDRRPSSNDPRPTRITIRTVRMSLPLSLSTNRLIFFISWYIFVYVIDYVICYAFYFNIQRIWRIEKPAAQPKT